MAAEDTTGDQVALLLFSQQMRSMQRHRNLMDIDLQEYDQTRVRGRARKGNISTAAVYV
jgi:hypothetical protein